MERRNLPTCGSPVLQGSTIAVLIASAKDGDVTIDGTKGQEQATLVAPHAEANSSLEVPRAYSE